MFQPKDVRQGIYRSNRNTLPLVKRFKGLALLRDRALVWRPRPQQRFKNTSNSWMSTCSIYMHRSIEAMHIKTAHFSPDMQSYPVTLKNGKCPQNITYLS